MGRKKRLAINTASSLLYQLTALICGFILPRLILSHFGSEVNGLVNSITQFLAIIAFLELGVGAVVQSSLYKPLADKDDIETSKIITSANGFFRKLAVILLFYVIVLICFYPLIINEDYDFIYTATLIAAMSISSFAQYYFGVVDRLLLTADQRGYIQYNSQSVTLIINTIACAVLINLGAGIQIVKLTTSLIYLARPVALRLYVNKKYNINRRISYTGEPIKQKWNGVAQHVAAVVLDQTDTIVLTLFSSLSNVSIYGVYFLVVNGVKNLLISLTNGVQALLGELWAKQEIDELKNTFLWAEWAIHTGVVFVFGCTASLIVPFVRVYTAGIHDANYIVPVFALLITLANGMHCLRLPYNIMILAGGHYKQTQKNYIIAALQNIIISVLTVKIWGLVGVAIGTLVTMVYQTVWMAWYDSRHFLNIPLSVFFKHICVDTVSFVAAFLLSLIIPLKGISYLYWIIQALEIATIWFAVVFAINSLLYKEYMQKLFRIASNRFAKRI